MVITEDSKPRVITGGVMMCNDFRQKICVMVNNRVSEKKYKRKSGNKKNKIITMCNCPFHITTSVTLSAFGEVRNRRNSMSCVDSAKKKNIFFGSTKILPKTIRKQKTRRHTKIFSSNYFNMTRTRRRAKRGGHFLN